MEKDIDKIKELANTVSEQQKLISKAERIIDSSEKKSYKLKEKFVDEYLEIGTKYTYIGDPDFGITINDFIVEAHNKFNDVFLINATLPDGRKHDYKLTKVQVYPLLSDSSEIKKHIRKDSIDKILEDDK